MADPLRSPFEKAYHAATKRSTSKGMEMETPRADGARVLLTGASRGIGRAIAEDLVATGAAVVGVARSESALEEIASTAPGFMYEAADLANEEQIERTVEHAFDRLGSIDVLINNAGIDYVAAAIATSPADWDSVFSVNVRAPFLTSCAVGRRMIENKTRGRILNVASIYAHIGGEESVAYSASKASLLGLTRSLAVEWATHGIRVNALCPGFVRTDMTEGLWSTPQGERWVNKRTPLGRWGEPDDLLGTVRLLCSSASDFVTGQAFIVDGGFTAQ